MLDRLELKLEFETSKNLFDVSKKNVDNNVVFLKYSKGNYYEVLPYSYQRNGFKQGQIIENIDGIKTTKNLYVYGFNSHKQLIEVKEGISIEGKFYYQFITYENGYAKSLFYDNEKVLINLSLYYYNESNEVIKVLSQGRRGGKEETYFYSKNSLLTKIDIKQYDRSGIESNPFTENFVYDEKSNIVEITKIFDNGFTEQIFPCK